MTAPLSLVALLVAIPLAADEAGIAIEARFDRGGRVIVPAKLNGSQAFHFLLDTACTIPTIHPDLADELKLAQRGFVRIHGIAGVERAPTYPNVSFDLGGAIYSPRRVASIPSEREQSRRRRDGVIGSSFFEKFVVVIDSPAKKLQLHSSTNFVYSGKGEIVPFTFHAEIPVVKGTIVFPEGDLGEAQFELDTGCDSGLCLGSHYVKQHNLVERSEGRADQKFGVGGSTETHNGSVPALRLGGLKIEKPQTDFFLEGSPVDEPFAGHLGMGVFKNYRVIFDYSRKQMIIETP